MAKLPKALKAGADHLTQDRWFQRVEDLPTKPQKQCRGRPGLGSGRRWAGAVAASRRLGMVPADSWLRSKATPAPLNLGPPLAGRVGAVVN